jgi:monoamine oxidase
MNLTCEYLILGAGFSGLACARALCDEDYLIIEARGRAGGRVLTVKPQSSSLPVELGPEFMHGAHPEILKLCKELHVPFFDVKDTHLYLHS